MEKAPWFTMVASMEQKPCQRDHQLYPLEGLLASLEQRRISREELMKGKLSSG
jgi:hypothetical protein